MTPYIVTQPHYASTYNPLLYSPAQDSQHQTVAVEQRGGNSIRQAGAQGGHQQEPTNAASRSLTNLRESIELIKQKDLELQRREQKIAELLDRVQSLNQAVEEIARDRALLATQLGSTTQANLEMNARLQEIQAKTNNIQKDIVEIREKETITRYVPVPVGGGSQGQIRHLPADNASSSYNQDQQPSTPTGYRPVLSPGQLERYNNTPSKMGLQRPNSIPTNLNTVYQNYQYQQQPHSPLIPSAQSTQQPVNRPAMNSTGHLPQGHSNSAAFQTLEAPHRSPSGHPQNPRSFGFATANNPEDSYLLQSKQLAREEPGQRVSQHSRESGVSRNYRSFQAGDPAQYTRDGVSSQTGFEVAQQSQQQRAAYQPGQLATFQPGISKGEAIPHHQNHLEQPQTRQAPGGQPDYSQTQQGMVAGTRSGSQSVTPYSHSSHPSENYEQPNHTRIGLHSQDQGYHGAPRGDIVQGVDSRTRSVKAGEPQGGISQNSPTPGAGSQIQGHQHREAQAGYSQGQLTDTRPAHGGTIPAVDSHTSGVGVMQTQHGVANIAKPPAADTQSGPVADTQPNQTGNQHLGFHGTGVPMGSTHLGPTDPRSDQTIPNLVAGSQSVYGQEKRTHGAPNEPRTPQAGYQQTPNPPSKTIDANPSGGPITEARSAGVAPTTHQGAANYEYRTTAAGTAEYEVTRTGGLHFGPTPSGNHEISGSRNTAMVDGVSRAASHTVTYLPSGQEHTTSTEKASAVKSITKNSDKVEASVTHIGTAHTMNAGSANYQAPTGPGHANISHLAGHNKHQEIVIRHGQSDSGLDSIAARSPAFFTSLENVITEKQAEIAAKDKIIEGLRQNLPAHVSFEQIVEQSVGQAVAASTLHVSSGSNGSSVFSALLNTITFGPNAPQQPEQMRGMVSELSKHLEDREREVSQQLVLLAQEKAQLVAVGSKLGVEIPNSSNLQRASSAEGKSALETENDNLKSYLKIVLQQKEQVQQQKDQAISLLKSHSPQLAAQIPNYPVTQPVAQLHTSQLGGSSLMLSADSSKFDRAPADLISPQLESLKVFGRDDLALIQASQLDPGSKDQEVYKLRQEVNFKTAEINRLRDQYTFEVESLKKELALRTSTLRHEVQKYKTESERLISSEKAINIMGADSPLNQKTIGVDPSPAPDSGRRPRLAQLDLGKTNAAIDKQPTDRSMGSSGAIRNSPNEASRLSGKRSNKDGSPMGSHPGSIQTEHIKQRSGRLSSQADPSFIPSRTAGQNVELVTEQRKSNTVSSQFGSRGRQSSNSLEVSASMKERNSPVARGSIDPSPHFPGYDPSHVDLQHLSPLSQRHSVDNQLQSLQISQLKLQMQQNEKRLKEEISQKDKAYLSLKKVLNAPNQPKKIEELAKLLAQKDKDIADYQTKLDSTDTDLRRQLESYAAQIDSLQLSSAYATARIEELNKALAERETNAKDIMRFSGERSPVASAKNADLPFGLPQHSLLHHPNITKTLEDNESHIFNLSKDSERYQGLAMRSQAELEIRTPRVVLDEITKILKQATKSETQALGNSEGNLADKINDSKTAKPTTTFSKPRPVSSPEEPLERVLDKVKVLVAKIAGYEKELNEVKDRNLELERIKAEKVAENDELVRKLQGLRLEVKNLEKTIENFKDMIQNSPIADQLLRPASIETSMIKMDGNDMEPSKKPSIRLVSTRDVGGARPTLPPMAPNGSPERGRLSVKDNRAVLRRGASAITGGMNTFMSLPMTDDSNMGQMYDLIEELRRVGKAKDEVQGKIKDLLKEPVDDNNDSYSSGKFEGHRFNEETIKILEAHHWAGKRFFESEENSRTPGMMSPPRGFRKQSIGEEGIQDKDLQAEAQGNLISELLERIAVLERETNFYKRTVPVTTTGKLDPIDDQILPAHNNSKSGVRSEMFLPHNEDYGLDIGNRVKTEGSPYTPSVDQRGKMEENNNPKIDYKFIDTPTRFDSDSMQWMAEKPDPPIDINLSPVMAINIDKTGQGSIQVAISKKHHEVIRDLPQDRQLMLVQTVLPAIQNQTDIRVLKSALLDKVIEAETLALASTKQKELGYRTPEANPTAQVQKTKSEPEKPDLKIKIAQIEQLQAENQNLKEILEDIRKKFLEGKIVEVTQAEFPDSPTDPLHSHEELPTSTPKQIKAIAPTEDHVIPEKSVGKQQAKSAKQAGASNAFGKKNKPSTNAPSKGTSSASNLSKKQEKGAAGVQEQPRSNSKLHKQVSDIQGDLRHRDPSRKSSGLQPDKAASTKNLGNEQTRTAAALHTRPFSGPQSTRTVNTLGAGSEYDASSEALPQEDPKVVRPVQSALDAENAAVENELEELLKATTGELANLQEKCMVLEEQLSIKDSQTVALRRDLAVMVQQLEIFKKENLIAINQEEIDQFKAIANQMGDLTKTPDDLIAENSELVEYLKKSKDETLETKVAYLNALSTFQQTVTQLSEKEASPDQILQALQAEQSLCYDRSNLQLQQFNSVLWDAVVKQKKTASNLSKRVQTIERWNKDMLLGLPAVETEVQENLDLPPSLTPAELHALESVEFKPAQFPARIEASRVSGGSLTEQSVGIKVPGDLVADNPRTSDRPRRSDEDTLPIPNETMVDLLLSMVGLTEDLRQICNDETKTEGEKIALLSEKIDSFELMGQDGKLDLANIQRIIGRPDSVGEATESTNRRKPYSDIVEVPEEDDEEDTRRGLKSSVDRSKHNSRRQRVDSERRATESKEGSNETPGVSSGVRKTAEIQDLHRKLEDALEKNKLLAEQLEIEKRKQFVKIDSMVEDSAHESSRSVTQQSEDMMTPKGSAPNKTKPKIQKKKIAAKDKPAQDKASASTTGAALTVVAQTSSQTDPQQAKQTSGIGSSVNSTQLKNQTSSQAIVQTATSAENVELLKAELDAANLELEKSHKSASALQLEVSRLNHLVADLKSSQTASKTDMSTTKNQKDSASTTDLTRKTQDLENQLLTKDVEIAKLKSLFTNSKSQDVAIPGFGGLTSSIDEMLGDQLAKLALELKKSQSTEETLRQEVSSLRSQLISVQGASSRPAGGSAGNDDSFVLRARVADLEAQLAAATALINELQSQSGNLTVEDLSALRTRIEGLESQVISLQKEIESRDVLMSIKDGAIEDLKKQLNTHADKPKQNAGGRAQKAAMDDGDAERQIVKLISENQKLRENAAIFERNFEQRERELLDEINRLAGELTVIMNLQGTPVPASIHKTVENARLQSMLKNKEMVMNQMLEVMKNNKMHRR